MDEWTNEHMNKNAATTINPLYLFDIYLWYKTLYWIMYMSYTKEKLEFLKFTLNKFNGLPVKYHFQ